MFLMICGSKIPLRLRGAASPILPYALEIDFGNDPLQQLPVVFFTFECFS